MTAVCCCVVIQGDCEYILVRTNPSLIHNSFVVTTKNVPCGEAGITCTKAVHITTSLVRIRLVLGAPPSVNDVAVTNGRTTFPGGEIEVNDMFQYVKLHSGVEVVYDTGIGVMLMCSSSTSSVS